MGFTKHASFWLIALVALGNSAGAASEFTVIGWNLESGGADADTIEALIGAMDGVDLWGFSEVDDDWADEIEAGAELGEGVNFSFVLGTTGGGDRLMLVFDDNRFDLVGFEELHTINNGTHRSPLVAQLRETASSLVFLFMVNHLARGNEALRHEQATKLNTWATMQTLPVIAVGDYNFDWSVVNGDTDHDEGFDNMTAGGVFTWVRPPVLIKTQDSSFNSVLDFVFVANKPSNWQVDSSIIVQAGDFPDDSTTPDHRPVRSDVVIDGADSGGVTKQEILDRIAALEQEIAELRALVEQLPD